MTESRRGILERAGMVDLDTGQLGQPLGSGAWRTPRVVDLDGEDALTWEWAEEGRPKFMEPGRRLLDEFIRLGGSPPERIRDYARRWGVLHLCAHSMPMTHDHACLLSHVGDNEGRESVADWRAYARRAEAILLAAAKLRSDERVGDELWATCFPPHLAIPRGTEREPWWEWLGVSIAVNQWLGEAGSPGIRAGVPMRPGPTPVVDLGACGLFAAIGMEILFAVARSSGLALCSNCGGPYFPTYKPRQGQRRYCEKPDCQRAKARDAKRDERARAKGDGNPDGNR